MTFGAPKRRIIRRLRRIVFRSPTLYLPFRQLRRPGTTLTQDTELVIEGFPRSGNTWAEFSFRQAQVRSVKLAPAHVRFAASKGVPTLVVFRNPDDAVVSLLAMNQSILTPAEAFKEYVDFYSAIKACRSRYVLASFDDVTKRMDAVVRVLNQRFLTNFIEFKHTPENEAAAFQMMDNRGKEIGTAVGGAISRSNPQRKDPVANMVRQKAKAAIEEVAAKSARAAAHKIFHNLRSDIPAEAP